MHAYLLAALAGRASEERAIHRSLRLPVMGHTFFLTPFYAT
jgi:hypothetical protein